MATESSPVLLGVCDAPCSEPYLSPFENKIGGYPDFFSSSSALSSLPRCTLCGGCRCLVVQIYCPLDGSVNHRLLHIYCCPASSCSQNDERWLVLRSEMRGSLVTTETNPAQETTVDHSEPKPATTTTAGTNLVPNEWCTGADEWGDEAATAETRVDNILNLSQTLEDILVLEKDQEKAFPQTPKEGSNEPVTGEPVAREPVSGEPVTGEPVAGEPASGEQVTGPYFNPMYINVIEEPAATYEDTDLKRAEALLEMYKMENDPSFEDFKKQKKKHRSLAGGSGSGRGGGEKYEKSMAKHGDRTFQKFKKKLSLCPSQVLRYCWKGKHLSISDSITPPQQSSQLTCKTCGSTVVFELQLMPPLLHFLRPRQQQQQSPATEEAARDYKSCAGAGGSSSGIEFGTVLVYSCSKSCWTENNKFREEIVLVVPDPETEILNHFSSSITN